MSATLAAAGSWSRSGQQAGDGALGVQNAFALHFGRVGGEHRRDVALRQHAQHGGGCDTGRLEALQGQRQAAFLEVAGALVDARRRMWWRSSARLAKWLK